MLCSYLKSPELIFTILDMGRSLPGASDTDSPQERKGHFDASISIQPPLGNAGTAPADQREPRTAIG
jgi:hypothetical protein